MPGLTYNGSQGNNFSYNCVTFAENEEASPWEPYHVQHGFEPGESAVTVFYVWGNVWAEHLRTHWEEKLKAMLVGLEPSMGVTFVLDPIVAREFVQKGFDTKEKLAEWVHENARIPAGRYWDHIMLNMIRESGRGGCRAVRELPEGAAGRADPDLRDEPDQRRRRRRRDERPLQHLHGLADAREVPQHAGTDRLGRRLALSLASLTVPPDTGAPRSPRSRRRRRR